MTMHTLIGFLYVLQSAIGSGSLSLQAKSLHPPIQWCGYVQALGWLSLFLPLHHVKTGGKHWNEWLKEWMALWNATALVDFCDGHWMDIISRLAKYDINGVFQAVFDTHHCNSQNTMCID
jgi:hypothetical protein